MGTAMRAKKLVILLAVLLVVGLGLFGWFRPREVVLPENCRLRVTIDSFSDDRIFVDDPEKKAQLLERLSALRVRRYFKQPESDFPPGLTLRVGEYARVEVFDPSNVIVAYYTVSLIPPHTINAGSDKDLLNRGYITVTPLRFEFTDHESLRSLEDMLLS